MGPGRLAAAVAAGAVLAAAVSAGTTHSPAGGAAVPHAAVAAASTAWKRPTGLVQAANSKTPCIYVGIGKPLAAAEKATGMRYRCLVVYVTASATWAEWEDPWVVRPQFGYVKWVKASPKTRTLVITLNLVPTKVSASAGWRAAGAAGRYETYARRLARNLVHAGLGTSVIRLGPEMNGPWEKDWIGESVLQHRQWASSFAHIVKAMRSVAGAHFLFDWNVNAGYKNIPLDEYYPGDNVVNIIGIDAYDEAPIPLPPVGSADRWSVLVHEPLGLLEVYAFARKHHKPASIPEWGTVSINGDDGQYVREMGRFIATHVVAYQAWYDVGNKNIYELSSKAPKSLAAYRAAFSRAQ